VLYKNEVANTNKSSTGNENLVLTKILKLKTIPLHTQLIRDAETINKRDLLLIEALLAFLCAPFVILELKQFFISFMECDWPRQVWSVSLLGVLFQNIVI